MKKLKPGRGGNFGVVSGFEPRRSGSLLRTLHCMDEASRTQREAGLLRVMRQWSWAQVLGPPACLFLLLWPGGGGAGRGLVPSSCLGVNSPPGEWVQPIREAFKIEDVPVESFKCSRD